MTRESYVLKISGMIMSRLLTVFEHENITIVYKKQADSPWPNFSLEVKCDGFVREVFYDFVCLDEILPDLDKLNVDELMDKMDEMVDDLVDNAFERLIRNPDLFMCYDADSPVEA